MKAGKRIINCLPTYKATPTELRVCREFSSVGEFSSGVAFCQERESLCVGGKKKRGTYVPQNLVEGGGGEDDDDGSRGMESKRVGMTKGEKIRPC